MDRGLPIRILNAGSGPGAGAIHPAFDQSIWKETRIDIDPRNAPDLVGRDQVASEFSPARAHRLATEVSRGTAAACCAAQSNKRPSPCVACST
jgi:hypothetical protein